jgi:23S rRNA (guanosine2251-2'-O)-methyltransferase
MERDNMRRGAERESYKRKERSDLIFGVHAVIEAIKSDRELNKILIQKGMNKELFLEVKEALNGKSFQLQFVPAEKMNSLTSGVHQGVIAIVTPIEYQDIEVIVNDLLEAEKHPNILVLDRITDVRNFGAIARTAECQGVDAILIPSKGSALVTSDAMKASAGALNRIPVCKTDNLKNSIFYLQQSGLRIIACTEKTAYPLYEVNLRGSVAIIMGSEENGITQDLINMADMRARIPMKGEIESLNVGIACGMVLYEKLRQELHG